MRKLVVMLLALTIIPVLSFAQVKGGDIYGSVVLADGSKVPGVLVTLTGDLIGKKTTISSEQGNFRFLSVPPGTYELKFELEGFKTVIRKDIVVELGKAITLNVLMETSTLKEEVVVSGKVGTIDTRKTTVGVNVSKEMVNSIPTARNPWSVLLSVPGVMMDRVDVGGADSGQQSTFIVGGGLTDDTTWTVDGANITDPSAIGAAPSYLNINSYDELQVTVGSNDISAQTGGIQLNFVTKRAGNKTSGDFHLYVQDKAWEMNQTPKAGLVVPGVNRLYLYGVSLGGAVIKDKLWWFGSWAIQDIHKRTEANIEDATWLSSGYFKLNFQLGNTSGDFHLSYDNKQKWGRTQLSPSQHDSGSLWDQKGPGYLFYGGLSRVMGNLMLNLKAVYTDGGFQLDPRGSNREPVAKGHEVGNDFKIVDGFARYEGSTLNYITNRNTVDVSLDGNYFAEGALGGDHEIKFGVDYYTGQTTTQSLYPNQRILYIYRDGSANNYVGIYPDRYLDVNFKRYSVFIQDTMTYGKLTANIGLRWDKEQGGVNATQEPAATWMDPKDSVNNGKVVFPSVNKTLSYPKFKVPANWALLSPRLSLTYDITGDGKNVVKLSAGRYMSQSGNSMANTYVPYRYGWVYWNDANGDEKPQFGELEKDLFFDAPFLAINPVTGMNNVQWDSKYNTPYLDELTLTFEKSLIEDLSVSLTGFYKKRHNLSDSVDSRGDSPLVSKGILPGGALETKSNYVLIGNTSVGGTLVPTYNQDIVPIGQYYYNLKKSYLKYLGLQFMVNKKLSYGWMANLSVTVQDWKRYLFEEEILNMNNFNFWNKAQVAPNVSGSGLRDMYLNSRWMVKFSGMLQLPYGFNLTTFFQAREGQPQPLRRRVTFLNQGAQYLYRLGHKMGDERLPTLWMLNLGLEKTLKISDGVSATLVIDWYNATNNQIMLKVNTAITGAAVTAPRPGLMWTNAGNFQFGVRVNF